MSFAQEIGDEDIKMESVDENDVVALYNLGIRHFRGIDVPKDEEEAVKWFQKAALQGHAGAQFAIGCCCLRGIGIPKNAEEAVSWYKKAAEQEHANAQFYLASCYYRGIGIPKNGEESFMWFQKAVKQNKKFLSSEPFFSILNAIQKRPIFLTPQHIYKNGYICRWEKKPQSYKSDEEALSAANASEREKYFKALAKYKQWAQLPEAEKQGMIAGLETGYNLAQPAIARWRADMNYKLESKYPYPKSDLIFIEGLPKDTLTNVSIDTVIYYTGSFNYTVIYYTGNYNELVIQQYTVDFQDALAISMKKNEKNQ